MEKFELIIFDIDGTITEIKPELRARNPRLVTPNKLGEQQPKKGVVEKLAALKQNGIKMALATNRGGVAWGFNTVEEAQAMAQEAADLCGIPDVPVYICPYHAKARGPRMNKAFARDDECRKPKPGMLLQAMEHYAILPEKTLFVGDYETDQKAAENGGTHFAWAEDFFAE